MNTGLPLNVFSSLQQLKFDAANTDKTAAENTQTIEKMATQFESLFVHEMLKSMRATLPKDGMLGSDAVDQYMEMYDQQLSLHIAKSGLGLKNVIMQQLGGTSESGTSHPMAANKDEFVQTLMPVLQSHLPEDVDAKAVMAMAALETGWGKSVIADQQGNSSHNVFSIKANKHWQGDHVEVGTHEYIHGNKVHMKEPFRAYTSLDEAVTDFSQFMQKDRYSDAMKVSHDGEAFIHAVAKAGYATDPEYANKVLSIYKQL